MSIVKTAGGNANQKTENAKAEQVKQTKDTRSQGRSGEKQHTRGQGLGSIYSGIQRDFKRSQMGEVVSEFTRVVDEMVKDGSGHHRKVTVLPLDGSTHSMHYSAVALVSETVVNNNKVAAAYTMILESSNNRPAPRIEQIGRTPNVEVLITAMDAWDQTTWDKVQTAVSNLVGHENILNAGATTVPATLDPKEAERVYSIVWAANEALYNILETTYPDQFEHLNLATYVSPTDRIVVNAEFNTGDEVSIVGTPVRSDFKLRMATTEVGSDDNIYHDWQHRNNRELLDISGFVNPIYIGPQAPEFNQQQAPTQTMLAQLVLTQIAPRDMPFTPEAFFLGVATATLLGDHYTWANQFRNYGKNDMHDIGAVGLRSTLETPQFIDTSTNNFGDEDLNDLIRATFNNDFVLAIDCEDTGPDSWITANLVDAAHGDQGAEEWCFDVLDRLTDGHFSQYHDGSPLFESLEDRIHVGEYRDENNELRDLRDLDVMAILNATADSDPAVAEQWEMTFNDESTPIELRLAIRLDIIRSLLGERKVNIRGFAERIIVTNSTINAMISAVEAAGLAVDSNGLNPIYGTKHRVGNTTMSRYAGSANAHSLVRQRSAGRSLNGRRAFGNGQRVRY